MDSNAPDRIASHQKENEGGGGARRVGGGFSRSLGAVAVSFALFRPLALADFAEPFVCPTMQLVDILEDLLRYALEVEATILRFLLPDGTGGQGGEVGAVRRWSGGVVQRRRGGGMGR